MSEEIVIKTETVKVEELQGRDKQIYDYAYEKGREDAIDFNKVGIVRAIARVGICIMVACFLAIFLRGCEY